MVCGVVVRGGGFAVVCNMVVCGVMWWCVMGCGGVWYGGVWLDVE